MPEIKFAGLQLPKLGEGNCGKIDCFIDRDHGMAVVKNDTSLELIARDFGQSAKSLSIRRGCARGRFHFDAPNSI